MFRSVYYVQQRGSTASGSSVMAARRMRYKKVDKERLCSYHNFNPLALLSFVLLLISIILVSVSLGLDQWSFLSIKRGTSQSRLDSATYKTQGFSRRCIQYVLSDEVVALNLPSEQLPRNSCIAVGSVSCNTEQAYLESAHDSPSTAELQNTDNISDCKDVRSRLLGSFSLIIIGIFAAFIALILMFPTWYRKLFIIGAVISLLASALFGAAMALFLYTDRDYAGFFSLNGRPNSGCLGISFGLFVGSFAVTLISSLVGLLAFCYRYIENCRNKKD